MKLFLPAFLFIISFSAYSQECPPPTSFTEFNPNGITGTLNSSELIFNNIVTSNGGFETTTGEGVHSIYAANFWIGGLTLNDELKLAAGTYNQSGTDFYNGPLSSGSAEVSPEDCGEYDRFFSICEYESLRHLEYFDCLNDPDCEAFQDFGTGYLIPPSFHQYPAHGNTALNQDYYLAPFLDYNQDGSYTPEEGDCPLFTSMLTDAGCSNCEALSGHKATFWITNDKGGPHTETLGEPIGIEMHNVVYGFSSTGPLNDVLFHQKKLINRGTTDLTDTYMGYWVDFDLGNPNDDLIGCDINRNLAFVYHGDQIDEASNSSAGYGENPPAAGLLLLEGVNTQTPNPEELRLSNFTSFSSGINGDPQNPIHYYNYLKSSNQAGIPHVFPGTEETTNWMFGGDTYPNSKNTWGDDLLGDKRTLASSGPFDLNSGDVQCITNAYIHSYSDSPETSALDRLFQLSDEVQQNFENCFDCVPPRANIQAVLVNDFAYNFHNIATGDNYLWDFGDGTTSNSVAPGHNYTQAGEYTLTLTVSNECGTHTDTFTLSIEPLSVTETINDVQLIIYPNPAQNQITLSSAQFMNLDLKIFDSSGKLVVSSSISSNEPIDISALAKGHYMLKAVDQNSEALFIEQLIILN